jgi:hypothetical protein
MHDPTRYAELYKVPWQEDLLLWRWLQYQSTAEPACMPPPPKPLVSGIRMQDLQATPVVPETDGQSIRPLNAIEHCNSWGTGSGQSAEDELKDAELLKTKPVNDELLVR